MAEKKNDMVEIVEPDGETIYVSKEEFDELGREGCVRKYAARFNQSDYKDNL